MSELFILIVIMVVVHFTVSTIKSCIKQRYISGTAIILTISWTIVIGLLIYFTVKGLSLSYLDIFLIAIGVAIAIHFTVPVIKGCIKQRKFNGKAIILALIWTIAIGLLSYLTRQGLNSFFISLLSFSTSVIIAIDFTVYKIKCCVIQRRFGNVAKITILGWVVWIGIVSLSFIPDGVGEGIGRFSEFSFFMAEHPILEAIFMLFFIIAGAYLRLMPWVISFVALLSYIKCTNNKKRNEI